MRGLSILNSPPIWQGLCYFRGRVQLHGNKNGARSTGDLTSNCDFKDSLFLVGSFNPSEKYYSVAILIPNIWKKQKCSKPPNSLYKMI